MKALFIDRDGVLNEVVYRNGEIHSPTKWEEVRHTPGLEALGDFSRHGFKLVMITNQPDLERGIVTQAFLDELHGYYKEKIGLDAVYVCPHESNDHPMKKPNPGMFLQAARDLGLTLSDCFHLGDTERDTIAAERCGCKSILWDRSYNQGIKADFRVKSMGELRKILIGEK